MTDLSIPQSPHGGNTLIVDAQNGRYYPSPSAALKDVDEHDQVYVRPGIYEDKIFVSERRVITTSVLRSVTQAAILNWSATGAKPT